jgi:hypothetical protein
MTPVVNTPLSFFWGGTGLATVPTYIDTDTNNIYPILNVQITNDGLPVTEDNPFPVAVVSGGGGGGGGSDASDGPAAPGTAASTSSLAGLIHNATSPTVGSGQQVSLQGDSAGNLLVNVISGTVALGSTDSTNLTTVAAKTTIAAAGLGTTADTAWVSGAGSLIAICKAIVNVISSTLSIVANAVSTGGCSVFAFTGISGGNALLTNSPTLIKGSAGSLYGVNFNGTTVNTTDTYVLLYDAATTGAVVLGTTLPKLTFTVYGNDGIWEEKFTEGARIAFINGIVAVALTSVGATSSTPAPTGGLLGNIYYK